MWLNILVIILELFVWSVNGQAVKAFCEDKQPLKTVFTLKNVTYVMKGDMVYQTPVGQPVGPKPKATYFKVLFDKGSSKYPFDTIQTGFIITDKPDCSAHKNSPNLKLLCEKLPDIAVIIGHSKGEQVYRTYHLEYIMGNFPAFTPVTADIGMPSEGQLALAQPFWPHILQQTGVRINHSIYDQRAQTLNLIIDTLQKVSHFYFNFFKNKDYPIAYTTVDNVFEGKAELYLKGFLLMPSKGQNNSVFGIGNRNKTGENLLVFEVDQNFKFKTESNGNSEPNKSITIDDIYGCGVVPSGTSGPDLLTTDSSATDSTDSTSESSPNPVTLVTQSPSCTVHQFNSVILLILTLFILVNIRFY